MKTFSLSVAVLLLFSLIAPLGASDTVRNFELGHVKIPVYQKGKLDFIIFASKGKRNGDNITGTDTLIDRLLPGANVDLIPDGWQTEMYPLNAPLPEVLRFWQKRFDCSSAVLFTDSCNFDRKNNVVQGNSEVMLRTPEFDLNGIGFRSDLGKKELEIRSDVEIIYRRDDSAPVDIITKKIPAPAVYHTISATGDSLRLDMLHNEIMLIGNVKVIDGPTTLNCDRLTVFLKSGGKSATTSTGMLPKNNFSDSSTMVKGVSRILADGEVLLKRRPDYDQSPDSTQYAKAEHLEYELDSGRIILTGEDELPELIQDNYTLRGSRVELLRFSKKAFVKGNCSISEYADAVNRTKPVRVITSDQADFDGVSDLNIFTGNVTVTDNDADLKCNRMRIFLNNNTAAATPAQKGKNMEFSPVNGSRELKRILCDGPVMITSKPKAGVPAQQSSTVNSLRAELDYTANKLVFYEKVKVVHKGDTLDCDRLDLFLKDSAKNAKAPGSGVALGGRASNDKTLTKVIASGKVVMKNKQSDLTTELMTLDFQELPQGAKPSPGMFASNNVQLTHIACDGKVVAGSFPGAAKSTAAGKRLLKAEHAMSDLIKNRSEFHKNVLIQEENNTISCNDMYVFTGKAPAAPQPVVKAKPEDDPDADPFALDMSENSAPSRIALSDGIDLERIVCKNNVILTNRDNRNQLTYAGGDTAIYTVKSGDIVISAEPPSRPYLRRDGRIQFSDVIRGNLQTEELYGNGNVQVVPDKNFKQ